MRPTNGRFGSPLGHWSARRKRGTRAKSQQDETTEPITGPHASGPKTTFPRIPGHQPWRRRLPFLQESGRSGAADRVFHITMSVRTAQPCSSASSQVRGGT